MPDETPLAAIPDDAVQRLALRMFRVHVYGTLPEARYDASARRQWDNVLDADDRETWLGVARAMLADLGLATLATDPAPAAADEVARLQELLSYIELHVNWRWLSGKCTTEQREMWADAVDRFSDGEPRADRWWREPTAPQAPAEPEPCGQVHGGEVCTKPRVPTTNSCWGHYGPEPDPDAQYACDPAHHVAGQEPCPHCQPIPGRPQAPAEPAAGRRPGDAFERFTEPVRNDPERMAAIEAWLDEPDDYNDDLIPDRRHVPSAPSRTRAHEEPTALRGDQ